jgi:hypothetical protein
MKRASIFIPVLIMATLVFNASAGEKKSWLTLLVEAKDGNLTKSQRVEIADEFLKKIKALDAYIPSLTPKESQWLDTEWNSLASLPFEASNQKAFRLSSSPEYQTKQLKEGIGAIRVSLECIRKWAGVSMEQEMFCWAYTAYNLTDKDSFNDSIRILIKHGKIDLPLTIRDQIGLSPFPGEDFWIGFNMYGRLVQSKIVLPYMADKIPK